MVDARSSQMALSQVCLFVCVCFGAICSRSSSLFVLLIGTITGNGPGSGKSCLLQTSSDLLVCRPSKKMPHKCAGHKFPRYDGTDPYYVTR